MSAVQFSNLIEQLFSLMRCELNSADVVGARTMFVGVVVAEIRLHDVGAEQRVRHE